MGTKNTVEQYNKQRNRHCKTVEIVIKDIVEDILQAIDDDLYKLINNIKFGDYSLNEIAERIEEIKENYLGGHRKDTCMRVEKDILDALKISKEVCEENRGCCSNCILRNGEDYCAVLNNSGGDTYENLQEWDLKREDKPRLILN